MSDETPGAYVLTPGRPRRRFPWLRRRLTLQPYQVGIVIRDGRVEEVFSEGARRLPRGEVQTYVASTAPFNLVFWLKDPGDPSEPEEGIALDQPVLTSDSQLVTGRIDLTLSVVPDNAERLLQLPRPSGVITPADVGDAIKAELLAKVLALDIHRHTAGELRGNRDLFRGIGDSLETELASTIARYGLNLDNFYPSWGLTHEERERIEEQRHQSAIREIQRKKELDEARSPSEVATPDSGPRPAETPPPPRPEPVPTPRTGRPTRREWVSLSDLDPRPGDAPPVEISFPNGERTALAAWTSIQRETLRWLISKGMLDARVPGGQPGKLLVNNAPVHYDGSPFPEAAEVNGWYTPLGMDGRDVVQRTVRIVEHVGQYPARFQVRFATTDRPAQPADPGERDALTSAPLPAARRSRTASTTTSTRGRGESAQQPTARRSRTAPRVVAAVILVAALLTAAYVMRPKLAEMFEPPNTPAAKPAAAVQPTNTPVTGPVAASNIPFPTRTPHPAATVAAIPTPTPTTRARATVQPSKPAIVRATRTPMPTPDAYATAIAKILRPTRTPTAVSIVTVSPVSRTPPVFPVDPRTVVPTGARLHDPQEIRVPNGHGGVAPWRDGGGQRIFSMWVYGTIYQIDKFGVIRPYIGISHTVNRDKTVWTVKLRENAVFQDGTPITASDFKAYWEHGAKPENIVAWGGASLSLGDIAGWEELRAGDVTQAEGLRAIDDHTLEVTTAIPFPTWPLAMAAWHTGISKFDQMLWDQEWFTRPIGAGPYKWTTDPNTQQYTATADVAVFWGPSSNIKKLHGLNVSDRQVQVIMFENGELDLMSIDSATYEAALNPSHPFHRLLKVTPYGGLWFIKNKIDMAPLEDLLVRKALAHGADMRSIVRAVWGPTETFATGLISPLIPCHNPDARGHYYDPELARQALATSSYGSADNLPPLLIDLARPLMINMGVGIREYWRDNLGIDLDILKRESGMPRREASQFYRISLGSWIPDPIQIVSNLTRRDSIEGLSNIPGGYPVLDALVEFARSLPLDHPDRCAAWQAVEEEYMDKVYMLPIRWVGGVKWLVQPWVVGFEGSSNLDINTLPWMYVLQH